MLRCFIKNDMPLLFAALYVCALGFPALVPAP
jgi:hypothetical protein